MSYIYVDIKNGVQKMKKVISLILAIIMTFSISFTAFAETGTVKPGERITISTNDNVTKIYNFKVPESGIYVLKTEIFGFGNFRASVIKNLKNIATAHCSVFEGSLGNDYTSDVYFCAEKSSTLIISVEHLSYEKSPESPAKSEFVIEKYDAPIAVVGDNRVEKIHDDWYIFIPEQSGCYNFVSNASGVKQPHIELYDANGLVSRSGVGVGQDINNFTMSVNLEKGKLYGINCGYANNGGYSYTISYDKYIKPESIYLDDMDKEVLMYKGQKDEFPIGILPTGATPYAILSAKSADESIATASISNDGKLVIKAKGIGKTVITVCEENGASCECSVEVESQYKYYRDYFAVTVLGGSVFALVFLFPIYATPFVVVIGTIGRWLGLVK